MSPSARTFIDLIVWQRARSLVLSVYKLTKQFPRSELFGLTSQIRRSSISIPANIAEGFKKRTRAEKARYLNIAQASLEETRCYLILANDLEYCSCSDTMDQLEEVSRLLEGYYRKISTNPSLS